MKRKKIIVGRIGFIAIGLFLLSLYLKETFQYAFFNREQQQLFLFDSDYVSGLLLQPGGVALCLSRFLVQFFYSTVWSVSLTALLLLSIILASMGILRKLGGKWFLAPLAFCPAGTLILSLFDPCFFYEGLIAYAYGWPLSLFVYSQRNFANAIVSGGGDCVYSVWVGRSGCLFVRMLCLLL